jgi:beta-glucosidase
MATRMRSSWTGTMFLIRAYLRRIDGSLSNPGVRLGGAVVEDSDELLESAIRLAKDSDAVIAIVGLNADWETEGYDRTTLDLPGRTNELIQKLAAVNQKLVVVNQSVS